MHVRATADQQGSHHALHMHPVWTSHKIAGQNWDCLHQENSTGCLFKHFTDKELSLSLLWLIIILLVSIRGDESILFCYALTTQQWLNVFHNNYTYRMLNLAYFRPIFSIRYKNLLLKMHMHCLLYCTKQEEGVLAVQRQLHFCQKQMVDGGNSQWEKHFQHDELFQCEGRGRRFYG